MGVKTLVQVCVQGGFRVWSRNAKLDAEHQIRVRSLNPHGRPKRCLNLSRDKVSNLKKAPNSQSSVFETAEQ